jgi:hypothetical protein
MVEKEYSSASLVPLENPDGYDALDLIEGLQFDEDSSDEFFYGPERIEEELSEEIGHLLDESC